MTGGWGGCGGGGGQNCIFDENDFKYWSLDKVQSQTVRLVKTVWKNSVVKFVKKSIEVAKLRWFPIQSCAKKIGRFSSFKLCSSFLLELISRTYSWKVPKIGTIAHQYPVSEMLLGIFKILSPSYFLLQFFKKKMLNFANVNCFRSYLENETKIQEYLAPVCWSRLPLNVSKIKTCLWCS